MTTELTDTELRGKCAEAMGWKRYRAINKDLDEWVTPKGQRFYGWRIPDVIPNYPSDPAAALTLVDKLGEEEYTCRMENGPGWSVLFYQTPCRTDRPDAYAADPSFCRAICRAFLLVKGKE